MGGGSTFVTFTPAWYFRVSVGPSHTARPQGRERKLREGRDVSEQHPLHACCVLGSPLTASHVSLHEQAAKVTQHPHFPTMPSMEPARSAQSRCCVTETRKSKVTHQVGMTRTRPASRAACSRAPLPGAEPAGQLGAPHTPH